LFLLPVLYVSGAVGARVTDRLPMRLVVVDCKTCDREIIVFTFTVDVQFVRLDTDFESSYRCEHCGAFHTYTGGDLQLRGWRTERSSYPRLS
jgi:hypothetical protein